MIRTFIKNHLVHGELKKIAILAGLHPNSVYAWVKGRNQPSVISLIWFLRAMSQFKNISYEALWIEYVYTIEGAKDAPEKTRAWLNEELKKIILE